MHKSGVKRPLEQISGDFLSKMPPKVMRCASRCRSRIQKDVLEAMNAPFPADGQSPVASLKRMHTTW